MDFGESAKEKLGVCPCDRGMVRWKRVGGNAHEYTATAMFYLCSGTAEFYEGGRVFIFVRSHRNASYKKSGGGIGSTAFLS